HETGGIALVGDEEREIVMRYATTGHTAAMIPLFAAGPGAERFAGILRNDQ
ncbi:MAG: alkaline phosphatase, partial [Actinobacteria bacterium]|nr:alkaline phosphatase [Actinomycetota bacterium]